MDLRVKELIAIGASITANCQPCLEYHISKAREAGVEEEEIEEAITVGKIVRKGAAGKMDQIVSAMFEQVTETGDATKADGGCGLSRETDT